jgi:hypothetical protein
VKMGVCVQPRASSRLLAASTSIIMLVLLGSACSDEGSPEGKSSVSPASLRASASSRSSTGPAVSAWIAVFAIADDPSDLDVKTAELVPTLGTAMRASPVQCFRGLPAAAGSGYVLGAVAETRSEMRRLETAAGRDPLFEARIEERCLE